MGENLNRVRKTISERIDEQDSSLDMTDAKLSKGTPHDETQVIISRKYGKVDDIQFFMGSNGFDLTDEQLNDFLTIKEITNGIHASRLDEYHKYLLTKNATGTESELEAKVNNHISSLIYDYITSEDDEEIEEIDEYLKDVPEETDDTIGNRR